MGLGRQAKVLAPGQLAALLAHVANTPAPVRDRAIVLLNFRAGLRAKEIAGVRWRMLTTPAGRISDVLALENGASKGRSGGRAIPLRGELQDALAALAAPGADPAAFVIRFRKGSRNLVIRSAAVQALFRQWYAALGFAGASSHSGRRTFVTGAARGLSQVPGASLRDVQALAGHGSLLTTQGYIDRAPDAQRRLVELA